MLPALKPLIELQRIDLSIVEVQSKLAAFPKRLAESEALVAAARAALAKTKESQLGNIKERKKLELDVESWKEKARKYRDQSGAVKSNEAYKALLHEIETAEADIRKAEDKLLEHMVSGEEYDRQMKAGEKALAAADAASKQAREMLQAEQRLIEESSAALSAQREQARQGIPEDLLYRYQKLSRRYYGFAIAQMIGEACTGCRVHLRPHVVQRVRQLDSEEIVECESCSRILFYIEPPPVPAAQDSPAATPAAKGPTAKIPTAKIDVA